MVLALLATGIVVSLAIYVRSTTGFIAMPLVAALLAWASWRGFAEHPERRVILAQILGVLLAIDTLTRMVSYVFTDEVVIDGKHVPSDISSIAANLGGSYILWGMIITAIAVGMLGLASWWAWRRPERTPRIPK